LKIVVFGNQKRVGALEGGWVIDLNRAFTAYLREDGIEDPEERAALVVPPDLADFIDAGASALGFARQGVEHALISMDKEVVVEVATAGLQAPWPRRRIACSAGNYADHVRGMKKNFFGQEVGSIQDIAATMRAEGQWGFWKVPHEVAASGDDISIPKRTKYFDYEGEAAIIIGKRGKDIKAEEIAEYVWGVTLVNDWSIRDDPRGGQPMSFNTMKNFDGSLSLGPCIVVGELNPREVDVETHVNGELCQRFNTRDMVHHFGEILEWLSRDFTFLPGDVICGGTGAGAGADRTVVEPDGTRSRDLFLKPGDVVEVSSPAIGTLRNQLVGGSRDALRT
jgi:2-keto-4-pentenoate hydratase/2-oxohepta-3-ene-1,7-dioic acid hydratase in catechol pathway